MGDNRVQLIIEAFNRTQTAFTELHTSFKGIQSELDAVDAGSKKATSSMGDIAVPIASIISIYALGQAVKTVVSESVGYLAKLETSNLGIASAFMLGGKYIDQTTGQALQGQAALSAAQDDTRGIMEQLQVANMQTIATLDQLVRAYQETLPVAMARGFNRQQVLDFTVGMVQAAGAIGMSLDQLGEETRSMLTGAISPRTSRIATVLGLRNEDIAQYKDNATGLYDFLMTKLEAYQIAGMESQKTWAGIVSNTKDILLQVGGQTFQPLFEAVKYELTEITSHLVTIDQKTKKITWNSDFISGIDSAKSGLNSMIAEVYRFGMLVDKAGGSMTRLGWAVSGGNMTSLGKWFAEQNKIFENNYAASDKALQALADREAGTGKAPSNKPEYNQTPPGEEPDTKKKRLAAARAAVKKADQDAIADAELAQRTAFGTIDQSRAEDLEANKEWLRQRQLLHEEEKIDDAAWIESQRQFKTSEAEINADAINKKIDILGAEWEAKRAHYAEGKALDSAYAAYTLEFDKLTLDLTKATNAELAANDEARIASIKLKKKTEAEANKESTADALRRLSQVESDEKAGILTTVDALNKKVAILKELEALQRSDLAGMSRNSAEGVTAWNSQAQAIDQTRQKLSQFQTELAARGAIEGMKRSLRSYADEATNIGAQVEGAFNNTFQGMEDALVNFVKTGKLSFSDLANSIINDMIRIMIQQSITGPLASALSSGITSMLGGTIANYNPNTVYAGASPGPWVQKHDGGMIVPRFHFGGLASDEVPAVLLTKERVLSRDQNILFEKFVNKTEGGGSTGANIKVEIVNQTQQPVQGQSGGVRFDGESYIVQTIIKNVQQGGSLRGLMGGGGL